VLGVVDEDGMSTSRLDGCWRAPEASLGVLEKSAASRGMGQRLVCCLGGEPIGLGGIRRYRAGWKASVSDAMAYPSPVLLGLLVPVLLPGHRGDHGGDDGGRHVPLDDGFAGTWQMALWRVVTYLEAHA
jgi:hypothetical protein